jgi:hypothetical protein
MCSFLQPCVILIPTLQIVQEFQLELNHKNGISVIWNEYRGFLNSLTRYIKSIYWTAASIVKMLPTDGKRNSPRSFFLHYLLSALCARPLWYGRSEPDSLPNIVRVVKSRRMRWPGHVACMGEDRGVHRMLVGTPEGNRQLKRPRRRWEDNIKMDLQEVGGDRGDWMELAQDRDRWQALVGTVRNFRVP